MVSQALLLPGYHKKLIGQAVLTAQVVPREQETCSHGFNTEHVQTRRVKGTVGFTLFNTASLFKRSIRAGSELSSWV